jgi:hypothetical protein
MVNLFRFMVAQFPPHVNFNDPRMVRRTHP